MNIEVSKKRYYIYSLLFLLTMFCIALLQNYIRYGSHDEYNIWSSISYLVVSLLLFSSFLPLIYHSTKIAARKYRRVYVFFLIIIGTSSIIAYYLLTSVIINLAGFYNGPVSYEYMRQYFGREAFIHLLIIGITGVYQYISLAPNKERRISATSGRKEITLLVKHIVWIESYDHYLKIHTDEGSLLKRSTLEDMTNQLKPDFIRIHRKYLVNKQSIIKKERQNRDEFVILQSGEKLKVGRSFSPLEW